MRRVVGGIRSTPEAQVDRRPGPIAVINHDGAQDKDHQRDVGGIAGFFRHGLGQSLGMGHGPEGEERTRQREPRGVFGHLHATQCGF